MWGPHTIDCFASACNAQLDRFHTRFAEFGSLAIDSLLLTGKGKTTGGVLPCVWSLGC